MTILFHPQAANAIDYPTPRVAMLPKRLSAAASKRGDHDGWSAFLGTGWFCNQARYALYQALKRLGLKPGTAVLMPAFHCRSMIEPALYLNVEVLFYPLKPDLRPDLDRAAAMMRAAGNTVKAMVVPHYFGYPQPLDLIAGFCAEHGIDLVEDCAHAFYGRHNGRLLGTVGRFAVASPRKFFAIPDGGVLLDNAPGTAVNTEPTGQPWHRELKALAAIAMESWRYLQRRSRSLKRHETALRGEKDDVAGPAVSLEKGPTAHETGLKEFVPARKCMAGLRISRWLMNSATHARIVQARRDNYRQWLAGVTGLPGCRPLFAELPDEVVPYAFPLLLDRPEAHFHALKRRGLPIWRWENTAVTECAVSNQYRLRLLQLPCHQDLTEVELVWMIRVVRGVLIKNLGETANELGSCTAGA